MVYSIHPDICAALELGEKYPLAAWETWTEGPYGTSQRRAIHAIVAHQTVLVWGGNKSGKSDLNIVLALCYCMGGDNPVVQSFLRLNGLPADLIPDGPGRSWLLAPRHTDSIRYHRNRVEHFIRGARFKWSNKAATQEAVLRIWIDGYDEPAELWFKAHSQGVDGMKGDSIRYLGVDEQCPEPMLNQALIRLGEHEKGRCVFSMTHDVHSGVSWVKARFIDRKVEGATEVSIDVRDNPHIAKGVMEKRLAGMTPAEKAAALTGAFESAQGMVYPDFRRGVHVRPSMAIPSDWPRYGAADFGWSNPNVFLWFALSPDGVVVVYREFYRAKLRASEFGEIIKAICEEHDELLIRVFCDPSAIQTVHEFGIALGMDCEAAFRDVETGVKSFNARLADSPPTVLFHDSCVHYLREIPSYRRDARGKIIKKNDHGCDGGRYGIKGIDDDLEVLTGWGAGLDLAELEQESSWKM